MIKQSDIDYQERRGNYWSTSMQNVVKGEGAKISTKSAVQKDALGFAIVIFVVVLTFLVFYSWNLFGGE